MQLTRTIEDARSRIKVARSQGKKIGLVPTMGALHIGHTSLIDRAVKETDYVVVSIFVNPTQFGAGEDFEKYPRPIEADLKICEEHNVDLVFNPGPEEIYQDENITWVNVEKLTEPLCGRNRPGHFRGVTTVCAKLFNIITPDIAYFGQKDAQQAIVVKRMSADLNMPLEIVICPTVREPNGLAISSRNQYLSDQQRKDATLIYKSLQKCQQMIESGTRDTHKIISQMQQILEQEPSIKIEYISIVNADSLRDIDEAKGKILAAVAAKIGPARLIDNILIDTREK